MALDFHYTVNTQKDVDTAISDLEKELGSRKFMILWQLDVNSKLKEKGFDLDPTVRILEVCSAPRAKQAIDTNLDVAALLPCKITVTKNGGQTQIRLLRPNLLIDILGDERLTPLAKEVEEALVDALNAAR